MRVLLVEDDERTALFIKRGFSQVGYAVDHADNGDDGLFMAQDAPYDVIISDIMLPKLDGLLLIGRLRNLSIDTPIIVLSAKNKLEDRIKGLHTGCDDYLVKPFAFSELLARVQALLRRANSVIESTTLSLDGLILDVVKRKVFRNEQEIELQHREFALLEYLMRNAGRVVSKTMIMEHVWDYNFDPQTNVVEARICQLRNKIDRNYNQKFIHTVRGAGYILEVRSDK